MSKYTLQTVWLILLLAGISHAATIEFSGLTWDIKSGNHIGPSANDWSDDPQSVFVDDQGNLHLKIRKVGERWYSAEVSTQQTFGYGEYLFDVESNTELYDPRVVAGLFNYQDTNGQVREIDIELTRWGHPGISNTAQYTVQPFTDPANVNQFALDLTGTFTTQLFVWNPDSILFASYHGHPDAPLTNGGIIINQWLYTGQDIPTPDELKVHINLWLFASNPPAPLDPTITEIELIVKSFRFTPVPEPASLITLLLPLSITALRRRRTLTLAR